MPFSRVKDHYASTIHRREIFPVISNNNAPIWKLSIKFPSGRIARSLVLTTGTAFLPDRILPWGITPFPCPVLRLVKPHVKLRAVHI